MPTPEEILISLQNIARSYIHAAIAWHFIIYLLLIALFLGIKFHNRRIIMFSSLLLASVCIVSAMKGNYFNSAVFGVSTIISLFLSFRPEDSRISPNKSVIGFAGLLLTIFGLIYPEFLGVSLVEYAYSSPVGLLPCPTLSVLTGITLMLNGLRSKKWSTLLTVLCFFYGIFGAFVLGVRIDLVLLTGAFLLFYQLKKPLKPLTTGPSDHNHFKR